jgi:gamma-glutamylcyclotransferase (GGCT)/AIG2-like uncharacterized protein YtfP
MDRHVMKVFVYGTLKAGEWNNRLLAKATFVEADIVKGFKLYNNGFPYAITNPDTAILGEVWDLGEGDAALKTLESLDWLEGYRGPAGPNHYDRRIVTTIKGTEVSIYYRDELGYERPECPSVVVDGLTIYEWNRDNGR